jgi:hypothetical protein
MASDPASQVAAALHRLTASQLQPHDHVLLSHLHNSLQNSASQETRSDVVTVQRLRDRLQTRHDANDNVWYVPPTERPPTLPAAAGGSDRREWQARPSGTPVPVPPSSVMPAGTNYNELVAEIERLRQEANDELSRTPGIRRRPILIAVEPEAPEPVEPEPTPVVTGHAAPTERPRRRLIKKRISDDTVPPVGGAGGG